jgi:predicted nucleic acid-binding protein
VQIEEIANSTEILIDSSTTKDILAKFQTRSIDGYDFFILEAMEKAGIEQIITDDGDYVTVAGIKVFTANKTAIKAAKQQGKLLNR